MAWLFLYHLHSAQREHRCDEVYAMRNLQSLTKTVCASTLYINYYSTYLENRGGGGGGIECFVAKE